jgi:hypothetical protein
VRLLSRRTFVTLVAGAALLYAEVLLLDPLAIDVLLVLLVPVVALILVRVRPVLHWILFAAIVAASGFMIVRTEQSDSSTAGFGVLVVPLLLTVAVLLAAVVDRLASQPARSREPGT